jgi:hypothetical protein
MPFLAHNLELRKGSFFSCRADCRLCVWEHRTSNWFEQHFPAVHPYFDISGKLNVLPVEMLKAEHILSELFQDGLALPQPNLPKRIDLLFTKCPTRCRNGARAFSVTS